MEGLRIRDIPTKPSQPERPRQEAKSDGHSFAEINKALGVDPEALGREVRLAGELYNSLKIKR